MAIPRVLATAVLAVSAIVPVMAAPPAAAFSCAEATKVVARAERVYAGRIIDARDGRILVSVTEVWKGGPVEDEVWLRADVVEGTSWAGSVSGSEIPDGYSSRGTWVFAPFWGAVGPCSAWFYSPGVRDYLMPPPAGAFLRAWGLESVTVSATDGINAWVTLAALAAVYLGDDALVRPVEPFPSVPTPSPIPTQP
ncbi:hypothetical protein [Nocardioides sp.]|uniref:hypothetical protein n=1 Tax=Nocardioides sp. TaxID=35761 RepID=UPI002CA8AE2F|nr:hypothetical protein [Nocardioides sp.]HXH78611.1 hypothetical protein [Nocardioides sp.]